MRVEIETSSNPFPGLRPFNVDENYLYFGREGQSDELLRQLRARRFVAVVGTSGSGKSSLVRAGLLPALHGGYLSDKGSCWRVALFRPRSNPIGNLAAALNHPDVYGSEDPENAAIQTRVTEAVLRRSSLGLIHSVREANRPKKENLLVVVDQFEELFRFKNLSGLRGNEEDAAAFVKLLLEAAQQEDVLIFVVITMRSDYLGDCSQFWGLPEAINAGQYLIPRLTRDQRREAILGPIAVEGGEIAPGLVNQLLNEMGDNPDQLPALQHALLRTWNRWREEYKRDPKNNEQIDLKHYEAIGRMAGALEQHAEEAYNELPDQRSRMIAEKLFKALTEKEKDNREIRRPASLAEISAIAEAEPQEVIKVINIFRREGRSFLMPPVDPEVGEDKDLTLESEIDISHESLIRGWNRLMKWVDEEGQSAREYLRLVQTEDLYLNEGASLLSGRELRRAQEWLNKNRPNKAWAERYNPNFEGVMLFLKKSRIGRAVKGFLLLLMLGILIAALVYAAQTSLKSLRATAANEELRQAILENKGLIARLTQSNSEKERLNGELIASRDYAIDRATEASKQRDIATREQEKARAARVEAEMQAAIAQSERARADEEKAIAQLEKAEAERQRDRADKLATELTALSRDKTSLTLGLVDACIQSPVPQEALFAQIAKANSLSEMQDHDGAISALNVALSIDPGNLQARSFRAREYLAKRGHLTAKADAGKAIEDLNFILQKDRKPRSYLAHLRLAQSLAIEGHFEKAELAMGNAIDNFSYEVDEPILYRFDSSIPLGSGIYIAYAVSTNLRQLLHLNPLVVDGDEMATALHYERANLKAYAGGPEAARSVENALNEADRIAGKTFADSTETGEDSLMMALNWASLHADNRPADYGALVVQAALWERLKQGRKAEQVYKQFQAEHSARQDVRYDSLSALASRRLAALGSRDAMKPAVAPFASERQGVAAPGDKAKAGARAQKRLEICKEPPTSEKRDVNTLEFEIKEFELRGDIDCTEARLDEALELQPNKIGWLIKRARLRSRLGYGNRTKAWDEVIKRVPNSSVAYSFRGMVTQGDEKIPYFQKALEIDPANGDALIGLYDALVQRFDRAQSQSKSPQNQCPPEVDNLINLLERSQKVYPAHPAIYSRLGRLYNRCELDSAKALTYLETAIAMDSGNRLYYEDRERAESRQQKKEDEIKRNLMDGYLKAGVASFKKGDNSQATQTYARILISAVEPAKSKDEARRLVAQTISSISEGLEKSLSKRAPVKFWSYILQPGHLRELYDYSWLRNFKPSRALNNFEELLNMQDYGEIVSDEIKRLGRPSDLP